jgi:ATP/maltotriose-dependent transcriptional regulator MalT
VRHRANAGPLAGLTAREREVLAPWPSGHSNQGICERLVPSSTTLAGHVGNIFGRLGSARLRAMTAASL